MTTNTCPQCGNRIEPAREAKGNVQCGCCGRILSWKKGRLVARPVRCPSCSRQVSPDMATCPHCGVILSLED